MIPDDRHVRAADWSDLYDGDTVTVTLDIWRDVTIKLRARLLGVDTPELRGPTALEKAAAYETKQFVDSWLTMSGDEEWPLTVRSVKMSRGKASTGDYGKYGRLLIRVWRNIDGRELGSDLLEAGLARVYWGGERLAWTRDQLEKMLSR